MKIFGHFEADSDSRHSLHQESEKSIQSTGDIEDGDLRRKYLNEPSAKQTRSDHEVLVKHSKSTFMGYLRDAFKFGSKEQYRLERDEDGYVKKLYSEIDDTLPKSDEATKLMTYVSEFLRAKPKQLEASGDEEKARKIQKLLAKVNAHHGNEWFQELDESGDTRRHEMMKSISNESLEVDEEDDSLKRMSKNEVDENLVTKNQHGSEWFQNLGERGDTSLQKVVEEEGAEGFLKQSFETKEGGAKFIGDGLQIPEVIMSYLTDLLNVKLDSPQEEVKTEKERKDNFMVVAHLTKVLGTRSERLEDAENAKVKSEDPVSLGGDTEQVEVPQPENEYDAKIRTYLDGLFKSKSEGDVPLVGETTNQFSIKPLPSPEESEEIVTIATDFEGEEEAGSEVSGIEENEIGQETKSFDCNEENLHVEVALPNGLINCAIDVVKIFSKRNYPPPEKEELDISRAIEEEDYVECADEEDEFEEALDEYSDEEYSLANPIDLKSLAIDVAPSHKLGSILHRIYNSGYKHILPQSIEENSLLRQCRQFLSSPNITSPTSFVTEPYVNVNEVNSMSENAKNEDVFEDAQDFLSEKVKEGPSSCVREEVFQPGAGVKDEIRFLIRGEDCSQLIVAGKDEEELMTTVQDEAVPDGTLTISASEILGPSKPGRIYDAKLDAQGLSRKELTTQDHFGEPHEIDLGLDWTARNVLNFHLEERLGKKGVQKGTVQKKIRFSPPQTKGVGGGVQGSAKDDLVLGKDEPEVAADDDLGITFENDEMNITQKMLRRN